MRKNKLQKFAENKEFECLVEPHFSDLLNKDFELKSKWAKDFFKNDNPIILELGCGKGEYTIGLAQKFPDINFLGIDIKGSRLWSGAKIVERDNIKNAGFVRTKIDFITSLFSTEIDEIWLTFPDPFPEKPNRRLVSPPFLNRYIEILKPNSKINLKTDSVILYNFAKEITKMNEYKVLNDFIDLHSEDSIDEILEIHTTYEKKFMNKGKPIKYLSFILSHKAKLLKRKDNTK